MIVTVQEDSVEFVESTEVEEVMQDLRIGVKDVSEQARRLDLADEPDLTRHELKLAPEQLAARLEEILGRLSLDQMLLVPTGRWSDILDAVAFGMAEVEAWQEFDHVATVHRNGRDPVLCNPADLPLLRRLVEVLARDGEGEEQSLQVLTPSSRMVLEVSPPDRFRATFADPVRADLVSDLLDT